jgi:glycine/D-amino acid oxidase-like deaminating enzyme/nitrite reductase/ring-hydroxylating ferredoxin subunit
MKPIWKANGTFSNNTREKGESIWVQEKETISNNNHERKKLTGDLNIEVAVIGGGLAGILTAYMLQQRGVSVIVLECFEIGSGITRNTTGKITSQHGLIYQRLLRYKGEERARAYAAANQRAVQKYEDVINLLHIECDYSKLSNYIFSLDNENRIQQEVQAAKRLGLPASLTRETKLPFQVKAAIRFENQAQFHPIKFLHGISKELTIYEHTKVMEIQKDGLILTEQGNIRAKFIVITTHYPFINFPGLYFIKLHQEREYLAALEWDKNNSILDGMYLDADPNGFTFRNHQNYLLLGSGSHRAGKQNPEDAYVKIMEAASKWYPGSKIKYAWSNQDCMTPDKVPYIGRYSASTPNIYVATGFNKWGMTGSMVAAEIIRDMICKIPNNTEKVFRPNRMMFSGTGFMLKDTAISTINLLSEHLRIPKDKLREIEKGNAGVVKYKGQKYGVYRDLEDNYFFVTTKCPHLGCSLAWNQNEMSWDCPCHGSRFDYRGNLINNPAMRDTFDACRRKLK